MEADGMAADKGSGVPVVGLDNCSYMLPHNQVMTEQQLETLRRQICVYSTICSQLVEMHKVMSQQASVSREMDLRQAEANAQSIERNHGVVKQKLRATDRQQFDDTQDNASSSFLLSEAEPETHTLFDRIGNAAVASAEHGIAQSKISVSAQHGSGTMTVLLDGKRWEVPTGVVDVRRTFGDNTILLDSRGHMVPTNDAGVTFHPLHASESYTLLRHGEMIGEASVKPSSGLLANSLHHIPGILNEVTEVCKEIDALDHVGHLQVLYIFFDLL